ncbi:m7GpppX diphosphatase-like isoform X1 [Saccoglossus kowalevskii]|uniref:m7GpppX diphosphatase n=1 Tax=Saccoglossus kowalevskii TaxID=10224 RepID=A0ABM0GZ47_SACKO|nr:PREDICTED: m7GpppX diphosphatase-like [Saccoglossus kowalevskii]
MADHSEKHVTEDDKATPAKMRKLESGDAAEARDNFAGFKLIKVLNENTRNKCIFVHGSFEGSDDDAVVLMEKTPFDKQSISAMLTSTTDLKQVMQNDIYGVYTSSPPPDLNGINTTIIYPATDRHIMKYSAQQIYLINETAEEYQEITLPFIESQPFSLQWVYNILDKKAESDRIIFEDEDTDTGFILLPDMKWDEKLTENLYIIGICHKRGIRSLRDLGREHLPLLNNIAKKGKEAICTKYGVKENQLRVYLHYQPSYYHLHVHFTHVNFDAPGMNIGKAHLLLDVMENIEMQSDYYPKKTFTFTAKEKDPLYLKYKAAGKM